MKRIFSLILLIVLCSCGEKSSTKPQISKFNTNTEISIRAIQALNDSVVWASGTESSVIITTNGGKDWKRSVVCDSLDLDFRSLWVIDDTTAIVVAIANPALIFKTTDKAKSWREVYRKEHKGMFLNSISFKDSRNGVIVGDPIDNQFYILNTKDGGENWEQKSAPQPYGKEGCFAASNNCITYLPTGEIMFVTGIGRSGVHTTNDTNWVWESYNTNRECKDATDGIYSIYMYDNMNGVVGGGNYLDVEDKNSVVEYTQDGGKSWSVAETEPHGFVSSIRPIATNPKTVIAVGSHGVSISHDMGRNWEVITKEYGYNAVATTPNGNSVWSAGAKGQVAKISLSK